MTEYDLMISTTLTDTSSTMYFISTGDTGDFAKAALDSTTATVDPGTTVFTTVSSTVRTVDVFPDFSRTVGPTVDMAPSSSPALVTGDTLYKPVSTVPDFTSPSTTISLTDPEVSIYDSVTPPFDSTSSPDSTDSTFSGTGTTNLITGTTLPADGTATSTGEPTIATIPEITPDSDGAPSGSTGSTPTYQAGDSSFTAGTDTTSPDVPPEMLMNVPPPDVPPPDEPLEVPLPDEPPPDVRPPDIPAPDVLLLEVPPPDDVPPDLPLTDEPFPDVPSPDVPPEEPWSPPSDTLIDVFSPDVAPPEESPRGASVESVLSSSEEGGVDAGLDPSFTTLDRSDPADDLAPVDFTFPFLVDPNLVKPEADSGPESVGDLGNIPDEDLESDDLDWSFLAELDIEETGLELTSPDSPEPDGPNRSPSPPQEVDVSDPSAAQMEGKSSGEDSARRSESDQKFQQEKTGDQNEEKGTDRGPNWSIYNVVHNISSSAYSDIIQSNSVKKRSKLLSVL